MLNLVAMQAALCLIGQVRVEPQLLGKQHDGKRIVVEGVYAGLLGKGDKTQLRLQHCRAKFLPQKPPTENLDGNLEIIGDVTVEGNETIVRIRSIKKLEPDLVRIEQRAARCKEYRDWYALAAWVRQRGELYNDPQVIEKAREAYRRAVTEQRQAAARDPEALRLVGDRVRRDKYLAEFDFHDLDHEILWAELQSKPDRSPEEIAQFRRRMTAKLMPPDAPRPPPLAADVRQAYEADPRKVFRDAAPLLRWQLVRYWEVLLIDQAYARRKESGQFDALQIGDLAEQEIPDYPDIANRWYQQWVDQAVASSETLSSQDLERLAETLAVRLGDPTLAERTVYDTLQRRETAFRTREKRPEDRDANARYDLAREYQRQKAHLKPGAADAHAVRLLKETLSIDPQHRSAESELRTLGYDLSSDGNWSKLKDARAIEGVRNGMEAFEVERAQGGPPDAKGRLVTASGVRHQWIYQSGTVVTYIVFKQQLDGRLEVTAVHTQTADP